MTDRIERVRAALLRSPGDPELLVELDQLENPMLPVKPEPHPLDHDANGHKGGSLVKAKRGKKAEDQG